MPRDHDALGLFASHRVSPKPSQAGGRTSVTAYPESSMRIPTFVLLMVVSVAQSTQAGPLSPPVGPVVATMKTLSEVEPRIALSSTNTPGDGDSLFRITGPGSY